MFGSEYSLKPDYIGQPWPNKEKRLKETVQGSVNWIFSSEFDLKREKTVKEQIYKNHNATTKNKS